VARYWARQEREREEKKKNEARRKQKECTGKLIDMCKSDLVRIQRLMGGRTAVRSCRVVRGRYNQWKKKRYAWEAVDVRLWQNPG